MSAGVTMITWRLTALAAAATVAALLLVPVHAAAQDDDEGGEDERTLRVKQRSRESVDMSRPSGIGLDVFAGLDLGFAYLQPDDERESVKTGPHLSVKGYLAVFTDTVELDLGGAFVRSELSGSSDERLDAAGQKVKGTDTTVITTGGALQAAGNISLSPRWALGMVGEMMLGVDASFSPDQNRKTEDPASLIGAQLLYTWPMGKGGMRGRVGLGYRTDVNIVERQLHIGSLSLAMGVPVVQRKTVVINDERQEERERRRKEVVERKVQRFKAKPLVIVVFDEATVNFTTASARLSERSRSMLREVGAFLAGAGAGSWSEVAVEGHTDRRGTREFNLQLSRDRALSVRQALIDGGAPSGRVETAGYGPDQPLDPGDSDLALARNRRVELKFQGVGDADRLRDGLARIQHKYR